MSTDAELLRRYATARDEAAFTELVRRHLNLVYAAALRRTNGRTHLAEEIAQKVFTDLARKAASLQHHAALTGWLHRSTRYAAIDAARGELSRQKLNQSFTIMSGDFLSAKPQADWERLRPVIDGAMDDLKEADREIILLRYFDGLAFAAVGQRLRLTENAARMRTERALDKLRVQLGKRGVTSSAAALAVSLANQALATAPAGLATTVSRTAMTAAPAGVLVSLFNTLALNKAASWAMGAGAAAALAGLGWFLWQAPAKPGKLTGVPTENTRRSVELAAAPKPAELPAVPVSAPTTPVASPLERHSYRGQATPEDTLLSYAWACDTGNAAALGRLMMFNDASRAELERIFSEVPAAVRARYRTPQEFLVHVLMLTTVLKPPTGVEQLKKYVATDVGPERLTLRKAGSKGAGFPMVHTAEGWMVNMPPARGGSGAKLMKLLNNELLVQLGIGVSARDDQPAPAAARAAWPVRSYLNAGQATPVAALQTMAWACDQGDVETMARLFVIEEKSRAKVDAIYAAMPAARRAEWNSVQAFAAAIIVHDGIEQPYPGNEVLALARIEPGTEGRVTLQLPGAVVSGVVFQQTPEGWKYVVREEVVDDYVAQHLTPPTPR